MLRFSAVVCLLLVLGACAPPPRSPPPEPTCTDEQRNGDESDVDCGGSACDPCRDGQSCRTEEDCAEGACIQGICGAMDATCEAEKMPRAFQCACEGATECMSEVCTDAVCGARKVETNDHRVSSVYRDRVGERFAFDCAPGFRPVPVWGTGIYTLDSGVCTAAVHSGRFTFAAGGRVVIEIWPGLDAYVASERNGVSSSSWSSYHTSFAVLPVSACLDGKLGEGELDVDCGGECGLCADGQGCNDDDDCSSGHCVDGTCSPATCWNGRRDAGEEDVDCGGPCAPCVPPQSCFEDDDCDAGVCVARVCREDIAGCEARPDARAFGCACEQADTCASGQCVDGRCGAADLSADKWRTASALGDRVGEQFAFDCPANAKSSSVWGTDMYEKGSGICAAAIHAGRATEAEGGRVVIQMWPRTRPFKGSTRHGITSRDWGGTSGAFVFLPHTRCLDGLVSEGETDVDCGGLLCAACDVSQSCAVSSDCKTDNCENAVCVEPLCKNGRLDAGESAIDCGGPCPKCELGEACGTDGDCKSGFCPDGECAVPYCEDGVKGQLETGIDCGGPDCPACSAGGACLVVDDCRGRLCVEGLCRAPTCSDGEQNGLESDVDCGGSACAPCDIGGLCAVDADCASRTCSSGRCAETARCANGVEDGDESGVDCGGSCGPCAGGVSCGRNADCVGAQACVAGVCEIPVASENTSLAGVPGGIGRRWTWLCPGNLRERTVWGVDVYTADSPVCTAAVHAGLINFGAGGLVTVEERRGLPAYGASVANGVQSRAWGGYSRSYAFVPPGSCANGVMDGTETDVDCGGGACAPCGTGAGCLLDDDCYDGVCFEGHCGP